jgi:hypothetical protein
MGSPLHIRAPTRPLILQCVAEPVETSLVAPIAVSVPVAVFVSNSVSVKRCSTSTGNRADDRTLLTTHYRANQSACASAAGSCYLVTMTIPN